jgi:hypothetical protein
MPHFAAESIHQRHPGTEPSAVHIRGQCSRGGTCLHAGKKNAATYMQNPAIRAFCTARATA